MEERRNTIRLNHQGRTQYCSSEDLIPRDGRLTNVSEQGAGLLVREPHRNGEMVTVGFSLPGDRGALTATGVVRWSHEPEKGGWHPIGVDWLQLEETTKNRLQRFIATAPRSKPKAAAPKLGRNTRTILLTVGVASLALASAVVALWVRSLQWENRQLQAIVEQRNMVINQLAQEETQLKGDLATAQQHLADTASEVARLDQLAQGFGQQVAQLSGQVTQVQQSYDQVRQEREELLQRVLDLETERMLLMRRLSSIDELRLAIREAIETRKNERQAHWLSLVRTQQLADAQELANGNRGYMVRDGRPTMNTATVLIRVHDPEESF